MNSLHETTQDNGLTGGVAPTVYFYRRTSIQEMFLFSVIYTMYPIMFHHPSQASLVAADTETNFVCLSSCNFVYPLGISHQLAAHGGALDTAFLQLPFHKFRMDQTAHTADW